jgi:hypothetical protein
MRGRHCLRFVGETEYRQLQPAELQMCQDACRPGGLKVQEVGQDVLQPLYKQGLIYLSVPIQPSDHISIPPLEVCFTWSAMDFELNI